MQKKLKQAVRKSAKSILSFLPLMTGVVLLISLVRALIPSSLYVNLFQKSIFLNSIIGGLLGSILAGNPSTSYVIGGELLKEGIGLAAVTAFLVTWVTVGLIQFPAESIMLGKKFAILRNVLSFVFSIIVAITTVLILNLL
jgi:uncharacterized membrane protein YraQ (UPF0718 family)